MYDALGVDGADALALGGTGVRDTTRATVDELGRGVVWPCTSAQSDVARRDVLDAGDLLTDLQSRSLSSSVAKSELECVGVELWVSNPSELCICRTTFVYTLSAHRLRKRHSSDLRTSALPY